MKIIHAQDPTYIIRLLRGEEVVEQILSFCKEKTIDAAWIQGLGAVDRAVISSYNFEKREYEKLTLEEDTELLSLQGNIAYNNGERMLHAHVTLGRADKTVIGGHLHSMRISGTGEIQITKLNGKFEREFDEETGLSLLKES